MKKLSIYRAGPLFTEAEQAQAKLEGGALEAAFADESVKDLFEYDLFNPINADVNDKSTVPTAEDIYKADYNRVKASDVMLVCLDGEDAGTMVELGQAIELGIKIYAYATDMRIAGAGNYNGIRVPFGHNQYVIGALLASENVRLFPSFVDAASEFLTDIQCGEFSNVD